MGGARRQGAIAAKKLAVLRRAVARMPQSERVRRALLLECEGCLPPDELQREWQLQLRELPTSLGLWAAYLESVSRAFSSFTMPAYREAATRALAALAAPLERPQQGAPPPPPPQRAAMERGYLLLLLRLAHTERAAGFDERAVAMLQAHAMPHCTRTCMHRGGDAAGVRTAIGDIHPLAPPPRTPTPAQATLEYSCFCPPALRDAPAPARLAAFGEFWDAEAPRVGEPGARGWLHWRDAGEGADGADAVSAPAQPPLPAQSPGWVPPVASGAALDVARRGYWAWWRQEEALSRAGALPLLSATSEEEADADPERVSLYDDLGPLLVQLRSPQATTTAAATPCNHHRHARSHHHDHRTHAPPAHYTHTPHTRRAGAA